MQIYPVHPIRQGILSTFLLLVLSVTAAWAQNSEILAPLERQVTEARAAQDMDEPQIAESRYRSARLEAWNLLGKIAVAGDDLQAAREAFEMSSVAATMGVHEPRVNLAVVDYQLGEEDDALNQLRVLSERFRSFREPWEKLLPILILTDRQDEARDKLRDLRGIAPEIAQELETRFGDFTRATAPAIDLGGLTDLSKRERKKLRRGVEKSLQEIDRQLQALREVSPTEDFLAMIDSLREVHVEAVRDLEQGRMNEAQSWLRRAQKQGRGGPEVDEILAFIGSSRGESVKALLQVAKVARQNSSKEPVALLGQAYLLAPSSEEVLLAYGKASLNADLPNQARSAFEPLAGIYSDVPEYHLLFGRSLMLLSETTDAVEAFQKAVRRDPSSFEARLALGEAMNGEKRYDEAREHLLKALEMEPDHLDSLAALAEAEEGLSDLESAEKHAQSVLERDSEHAGAQFALGMVRMKQSRYEEARTMLEKVVERSPRDAKAQYQLSLAHMRLGDREKAQHHLEQYKKALLPNVQLMKKVN